MHTPLAPADPIFALTASYKGDSFKQKVNLGVGAYRDNEGNPYVLPVVRKVSCEPTAPTGYTAARQATVERWEEALR